jgi:hypothetical protein
LTYQEAMEILWAMISEETSISLVVNGRTHASVRVEIMEPALIPWDGADQAPPSHSVWVSEESFVDAEYLHAGELVRVRLKDGIDLMFAVPDSQRPQ